MLGLKTAQNIFLLKSSFLLICLLKVFVINCFILRLSTGVDVQPAKGQIFSSLADVAKHLQDLGVKVANLASELRKHFEI